MEQLSKAPLFKGKSFLVVDDEPTLREIICQILEAEGAHVREAENGLVAKTILDLNEGQFDMILSDVKMPELDGVALLKHCKSHYPKAKFIVFTGFSEILEAKQAFELGADGFLAKPFRIADLKKAIDNALTPPEKRTYQPEEDEFSYCRIHVDDFMSATKLPSDIYVRVADNHFVKVAREGSEIQVSRLQTYKDKKVDFFFVRTADFHRYTGVSLKLAGVVAKVPSFTKEQRFKVYKTTTESVVQLIMHTGLTPELRDVAEQVSSNTLNMVSENPDLLEVLMVMQNRGDSIYKHALAVSIYAPMIARKIGWTSPQNQYKLSVAGLFHNLGLKEIPQRILEKPRIRMTPEEIRLYQSHPTRSRDLILGVPGFPGDLAQIIHQHHENQVGTGYPLGLISSKIHPLAKVLRVADEFCERSLQSHLTTIEQATQVLQAIYEIKSDELDAEALGGLFDLLKVPRPPGLKRKGGGTAA